MTSDKPAAAPADTFAASTPAPSKHPFAAHAPHRTPNSGAPAPSAAQPNGYGAPDRAASLMLEQVQASGETAVEYGPSDPAAPSSTRRARGCAGRAAVGAAACARCPTWRPGLAGLAMDAGIDLPAEHRAGTAEFGELSYALRRFASVDTRSAFAIRTVASDPPFDSGSQGTHVWTCIP